MELKERIKIREIVVEEFKALATGIFLAIETYEGDKEATKEAVFRVIKNRGIEAEADGLQLQSPRLAAQKRREIEKI